MDDTNIIEAHLSEPRTLVLDLTGCDEQTVHDAVARLQTLGAVTGHRIRRDAGLPGVGPASTPNSTQTISIVSM